MRYHLPMVLMTPISAGLIVSRAERADSRAGIASASSSSHSCFMAEAFWASSLASASSFLTTTVLASTSAVSFVMTTLYYFVNFVTIENIKL